MIRFRASERVFAPLPRSSDCHFQLTILLLKQHVGGYDEFVLQTIKIFLFVSDFKFELAQAQVWVHSARRSFFSRRGLCHVFLTINTAAVRRHFREQLIRLVEAAVV